MNSKTRQAGGRQYQHAMSFDYSRSIYFPKLLIIFFFFFFSFLMIILNTKFHFLLCFDFLKVEDYNHN